MYSFGQHMLDGLIVWVMITWAISPKKKFLAPENSCEMLVSWCFMKFLFVSEQHGEMNKAADAMIV
jgi:hypothetical protein